MKVMKVKLCKVITLECLFCFRNNKIGKFDTLERQTMGVNKYASTFPMASCNYTGGKPRNYHEIVLT